MAGMLFGCLPPTRVGTGGTSCGRCGLGTIGELNSTKLKKVGVVHVLGGHERWPETKDYLW